jgi:hypothetical protein
MKGMSEEAIADVLGIYTLFLKCELNNQDTYNRMACHVKNPNTLCFSKSNPKERLLT